MSERDELYRLRMLEREIERMKSDKNESKAPIPIVVRNNDDFYGAPKIAIKATIWGNLIMALAVTGYTFAYRGLTDAVSVGIMLVIVALSSVVIQFVYYKLFWWVNGCLSLIGALLLAGAVLWALATGYRPIATFPRF